MSDDRTLNWMVRVDPDLHERVRVHGLATERTMSQVVRLAVRQYMEREEETQP